MKFCPYCNNEIYEDSIRCLHCGKDISLDENRSGKIQLCSLCKNESSTYLFDQFLCSTCAENQINSRIIVTTTHTIEGRRIIEYLGVESIETVLGTGIFSEASGAMADMFGTRATEFEKKLQKAKSIAFLRLKFLAAEKGANAIVGVDMDYTMFHGNLIGFVVNGTLVRVE